MPYPIGRQYAPDDAFKAAARRHQSKYRAGVLGVAFDKYGNRLRECDARALLNYYDGLNVRSVLRARYPDYSKKRDADMLRSEHIPFNMFAPLCGNHELAKETINQAFGIVCHSPVRILFEFAPEQREDYLNDGTAFDTYVEYRNDNGMLCGIGIEVKYSEQEYAIGKTERKNVDDIDSPYWRVTRASGAFVDPNSSLLGTDKMRQIWRNHLLGLSMVQRGDIEKFASVILYPEGNGHFRDVIPLYQSLLDDSARSQVVGFTYEQFIASISGNEEISQWKEYLVERYLVQPKIGRQTLENASCGV